MIPFSLYSHSRPDSFLEDSDEIFAEHVVPIKKVVIRIHVKNNAAYHHQDTDSELGTYICYVTFQFTQLLLPS